MFVTALQAGQGGIIRQLRLNSAMAGYAESPKLFGPTLVALRQRSIKEWDNAVSSFLADPTRMTFLGWKEGQPYGMIMCYCPREETGVCTFDLIWVDADCRRNGIGTALIQAAGKWAHGLGAHTIQAWISEDNYLSITFHQQQGFIDTQQQRPHASCLGKKEQQFSLPLGAV